MYRTMAFAATKARLLSALRLAVGHAKPPSADEETRGAIRVALRQPGEDDGAPVTEPEKQTLELVMRIHMEELLVSSKQPGQSIEAAGVPRLLDLAIALATSEIADCNTPFALLEDLFDAHVISVAESAFALVEARAGALAPFLTAEAKHQRCKLTMLRTCNELLRRLSKSKNTNFRGRVLMFMAYTFPLGERSGVNLKGVSAPSTVEVEAEEAAEEAPMQVDAPAAPGSDGVVGFGFYTTFWGLQKAFANPAASVARDAWPGLVERLNTVLQVFGSFSGSADGAADDEDEDADADADAADAVAAAAADAAEEIEEIEEIYFAKFLTSSKLMMLQLRDGYFRRHVLVQLLIFLQTIATERKGQPPLTSAQRANVDELHAKCVELLRAIPPGGPRFASAVLLMLEREEHWIKWKANGCVPFDKAAAVARDETDGAAPRKRKLGAMKRTSLGNSALTRLWNMGGNALEDIAARQQEAMPQLGEYLRGVHEQLDPEAGIEEEYKLVNDKAFTWKALRLMAKRDVVLLSKVSQPQGSLEAAVKYFFEEGGGGGAKKEGDADADAAPAKPEHADDAADDKMKVEL